MGDGAGVRGGRRAWNRAQQVTACARTRAKLSSSLSGGVEQTDYLVERRPK